MESEQVATKRAGPRFQLKDAVGYLALAVALLFGFAVAGALGLDASNNPGEALLVILVAGIAGAVAKVSISLVWTGAKRARHQFDRKRSGDS